jgi:hypothetical protein
MSASKRIDFISISLGLARIMVSTGVDSTGERQQRHLPNVLPVSTSGGQRASFLFKGSNFLTTIGEENCGKLSA